MAKEILFDLENKVIDIYTGYFANRNFAYTAKEIIVNLEEYLQALFLVACMSGRDIKEEEMRFIWSVLSHADIFTGLDSIDQSYEKAKIIINTDPHALLISVAVDKFYEKRETASIIKDIYKIYIIMCSLTGIPAIKKDKLLAIIIAFAQTQGVKL